LVRGDWLTEYKVIIVRDVTHQQGKDIGNVGALSNRGKLLKSLKLKCKVRVSDADLLHMNKAVRTYPWMRNHHLQCRTSIVTGIHVM
jgi:hypothetical protein